jgi:acetyltransferase-like isoleucine patch superfamily enzyme
MPINNCKLGKNVIFEDLDKTIIKDCEIGDNVFIGAYSKLINLKIGNDTKIFSFVNLYGPNLNIGNNCKIGSFVEIQRDVEIGDFCVISSHSFVCSKVTLEGRNFIGHSCIFSNDREPRPFNVDYKQEPTLIKQGACIGSGSKLLPIIVGIDALIGLGSVVVDNVPDYGIVYGKNSKAVLVKIKKPRKEDEKK